MCGRCSPGRTRRCPPRRRGCSNCWPCTRARTSPHSRLPAWRGSPSARRAGCSSNSPTPTCSPSTSRAATPSTTCCTSTPPSARPSRRRQPTGTGPWNGCSPGTCTPRTRPRSSSPRSGPACRSPPLPEGCRPLTFTTYDQALNWCTAERANLVAAVEHAATAAPGIAWRLAAALWGFFYLRSHTHDWHSTNQTALTAARGAHDRAGEAECLTGLANALTAAGRLDEAIDSYHQALPIYTELGDQRGRSRVTGNLGDVQSRAGRYEEAILHFHRSLRIDRALGHRWGEGIILNNLGEAYLRLGRYEEARDYLTQALSVQRGINNRWVEGVTLVHLGTVYLQLQQYDEAVEHYHMALEAHRVVGNRWGEANAIGLLAEVHLAVGDREAARAHWSQALRLLEEFDHPDADEIRAKLRALDGGPAIRLAEDPAA